MKNIRTYNQLHEGDPWDNDPSAPWNQEDPPEPEAAIEYKTPEQPFDVLHSVPNDIALLKKKSDGSLWVLDVADILDEGGEFDDYIYYANHGDDEYMQNEKDEDMDDESYTNIVVDLYKEKKYVEDGTGEGWAARYDDDVPKRLYKLNLSLAEEIIPDLMGYAKFRGGDASDKIAEWKKRSIDRHGSKYRSMANTISRAFPEAD